MTPKSLLRHKRAVSTLADMAEGTSFHRVMVDGAEAGCDVGGVELKPDDKITPRRSLCSGKVYFDLLDAPREDAAATTSISCAWSSSIRGR